MTEKRARQYDHLLSRDSLRGDLKTRSVRAGIFTVLGQGGGAGMKMLTTVVLARLLTPEDYGLVGMTMVVTTFVSMFADMGLSSVTVQREHLSHEQLSALFWLNLGICSALGLLLFFASPFVAWFFNEPGVGPLIRIYALLPVLTGISAQHQALLQRNMRLGVLSGIRFCALVTGTAVGVTMGYFWGGPWALVGIEVAAAIVIAVSFPIAVRWRPSLPKRGVGIREMLGFGGAITASNVINHWARKGDDMFIGRVWGTHQVGLYSRAYSLLCLPLQQIVYPLNNVAIPALSALNRNPDEFNRYYLKLIRLIASVCFPLVAYMAVMADSVTMLLLGEQWVEATKIFRVLAIVSAMQAVVSPVGCIYIATGRTKRMLKWTAFSTPFILLAFAIGVQWQAIGVAIAYVAVTLMIILPGALLYGFHGSPVRISGFLQAIARPAVSGGIVGFVLLWVRQWNLQFWGSPESVLVSGPLAVGAWMLANRLISANRTFLGDTSVILDHLRNRSAVSGA